MDLRVRKRRARLSLRHAAPANRPSRRVPLLKCQCQVRSPGDLVQNPKPGMLSVAQVSSPTASLLRPAVCIGRVKTHLVGGWSRDEAIGADNPVCVVDAFVIALKPRSGASMSSQRRPVGRAIIRQRCSGPTRAGARTSVTARRARSGAPGGPCSCGARPASIRPAPSRRGSVRPTSR